MALDFGINVGLVEELYAQYLENPEAVDPSWRAYFEERSARSRPEVARLEPPPPGGNGDIARAVERSFARTLVSEPPPSTYSQKEVLAEAAIKARVFQLLNAYRVRGHLFAHLDP